MLKIDNKADVYTYRILFFILCFLMTVLIGRYYYLQVIEHDRHFSKSQINRVKAVTTYAMTLPLRKWLGEITGTKHGDVSCLATIVCSYKFI